MTENKYTLEIQGKDLQLCTNNPTFYHDTRRGKTEVGY